MKKLNKKGFTLIEMLVVIAIIAILVAIIIPVVSAATDKAAAATDAANLRSFKAEIVTHFLSANEQITTANGTNSIDASKWNTKVATPAMKAVGKDVNKCDAGDITDGSATKNNPGGKFAVTYANGEFDVTYDNKHIDDFARFAETGSFDKPTAGGGSDS